MPMAADILRQKQALVRTIAPGASVLAAIKHMNEHHVGALLVSEAAKLVGIFTERDVLTRVAAMEKDLQKTTVGEVMTTEVIVCRAETELDEISQLMKDRRIRHVPIQKQDGDILGMVSIGDINAYHVSRQQATIESLSDYICGRA
jgi:CBS domain-containing protein